ncbi:MAG: FHA domain-containing protein [Myxococcales bacterium]
MAVPLRLKVFKGEELIATKDFDRDMIKIGRLSTAHLCLDDEKASRIHSVLNVEGDGKLSIVDMGSVEGTYLNGKRVNKGIVEYGDEIRIGVTRIVVERGENMQVAAEAAAQPQPGATAEVATLQQPVAAPAMVASPAPALASAAAAAPAPVAQPEPSLMPQAPQFQAPAQDAYYPTQAPASDEPPPEQGWVEERFRELKFSSKAFGSYVQQKPAARRTPKDAKSVGLQIRYLWGDQILQVSQHAKPRQVFIGSTRRCDLFVAADRLGAQEFELVSPSGGGGFAVNLGPGMSGELDRGGEIKPLKGGAQELRADDFVWVDLGGGLSAELLLRAPAAQGHGAPLGVHRLPLHQPLPAAPVHRRRVRHHRLDPHRRRRGGRRPLDEQAAGRQVPDQGSREAQEERAARQAR